MARRFGETVSSPASLSPHLLPSIPPTGFSPDTRAGTGSGRGLGCTRTRATARHDRMDCSGTSNGDGADTDGLVRTTLGPQHRPSDKVVKSVGRPARAASRRSTGNAYAYPTASSSSPSPARRISPRSRGPRSNSSCKSFDPRRKFHSRVTRANCKPMTDAHGNQLSPTAPYLSCELSPCAITFTWLVTQS